MFREWNSPQMIWYQLQLLKDEDKQFETQRNMTEYGAMFVNPEGVKQVKESRANTFATNDEEFNNLLEETFGKKLPEIGQKSEPKIKMDSYLEMELDDVSFIPMPE